MPNLTKIGLTLANIILKENKQNTEISFEKFETFKKILILKGRLKYCLSII